uniref:Sperm associated antigen 9 n=1 Tax=Cyclopterus lumpus TaxID=8103 RepID=A0A8C3G8D1_CYCLU
TERPISMGIFQLPGTDGVTSDLPREPVDTPSEPWRFNNLSHPRSNASLKDEMSGFSRGGSKSSTPTKQGSVSKGGTPVSSQGGGCKSNTSTPSQGADQREKSEVQAIIESTPELDMDLDGFRGASTPTKGGIENLAFDRNTDSLFAELSSAGNDLIGDMDEGADMLGMGREVEHLIHENAQLLETKNALNVVKNDLIAQMDELSCEKEVLRSELDAVTQAKSRLEDKNKELEDELKKTRAEFEDAKHKVKNDNEDDSDVPTAQRKRFTRVEMARVLMERNQYKESLWQFFSRLFSSSGAAAKKPALEAPVNVKYNAPTSQIQPSVKKRSTTLQQLPSDKSKAFDFLNEEVAADNVVSRREQKRAQYQQVKAHVQKEDGRVQAYGWSLPKKYKSNGGQTESKVKNLPVPVFLRPLDEKDASMKLWCAAGVNLSGGKTRDGGSIVGASVFYNDVPGPESPKKKLGSQSSLDELDQDLKEQQKELRQHDELSSLVWICTSTDFFVCNSHVLCIASVPGARETDYPAGEEVAPSAEAGPAADGGSPPAESSSSCGDGVLGGITVVGCDAEGAAAVPQTAVSLGEDGESGQRRLLFDTTTTTISLQYGIVHFKCIHYSVINPQRARMQLVSLTICKLINELSEKGGYKSVVRASIHVHYI